MGLISYSHFSHAIEKKSSTFYWISLLETDRKLNFALNEISAVSNSAITQPSLQQLLKRTEEELSYDQKQEMNNLLINHSMITSFSLYSNDRLIYEYNAPMTVEELRSQPWYHRMKAAEGRPIWSGPGENGSAQAGRPQLIHARVIKDYYSLENIGSLVISVKPDVLDQVFWEAATLKKGDILLVNKEGSIVFTKSGLHIGERAEFPFLKSDYTSEEDYYIDRYRGERSLITYLPSHDPEWTLVAITPLQLLQSESVPLRNIAVALVAFSLVSALLFDRFFVARLVRTIISTLNGMRRVERRVFTPISSYGKSGDETDLLISGFNQMSKQINELLHQVETEQARKKEAELQALVAQINPHFIYNSLESINSMAVLQGNKEISRMVVSLGKLLRISISENQELIPLQMEFEHVRHYLNIQKFRFEDKFEYELELPDSLKGCMTQKLIVQPIVENALYHAIEPMEGKGYIHVRATDAGHSIWIDVTDNGPGFDNDTLSTLWEDTPGAPKKYRNSGVGLKNVHERLRIRFGGHFGILVCSSPGSGSIIRIRVPKITPYDPAVVKGRLRA